MQIRQISVYCGLVALCSSASAQITPVSRSSHLHAEYSQSNYPSQGPSYIFDQTYSGWVSEEHHNSDLIRETVILSNSRIRVDAQCYGSANSSQMQQWWWSKTSHYVGDFIFNVETATPYNLDLMFRRNMGSGVVTLYNDITNTSLYTNTGPARSGSAHFVATGTLGPGRYRLHIVGDGPAMGALGDGTFNSTTNLTFVPTPGVGAMLAAAGLFGLRRRR